MCYGSPVAPLYSEVILGRFRHPRYLGELTAPDAAHEDVNPLCGDRIRMEIRLGQGPARSAPILEAVRFRGDACAIAVASADLLAEIVEGRTPREAALVDRETLLEALRAPIRSSRLGCVTLPLTVLRGALAELGVVA